MKKILFIIVIFFVHTLTTHAASVSIVAPTTVETTNQFSVSVYLNTDGVSINSIDIMLSYPDDIMIFQGYKEDGGVKKIWIQTPKEQNGTIHFSGIIPGGVDGIYDPDKIGLQPVPLTTLLFSPRANGSGDLSILNSKILQNDGIGSELLHTISNQKILVSISNESLEENKQSILDKELPEPFKIEFIPSGLFSETPSMISFFAVDNLSGVAKYQVKDGSSVWKDATSPLVTPKGIVKRTVTVRAIDFSGNVRESSIDIPGILSAIQLVAIFILFIVCYFMFFVVKRRR